MHDVPKIVKVVYFMYCRNEIEESDDQSYSGTGESFNDSLPTAIAKQFCSIYDNDWSEAFSQINEHFEREKEDDIVKNIAVVTQVFLLITIVSMHFYVCAAMSRIKKQFLKIKIKTSNR